MRLFHLFLTREKTWKKNIKNHEENHLQDTEAVNEAPNDQIPIPLVIESGLRHSTLWSASQEDPLGQDPFRQPSDDEVQLWSAELVALLVRVFIFLWIFQNLSIFRRRFLRHFEKSTLPKISKMFVRTDGAGFQPAKPRKKVWKKKHENSKGGNYLRPWFQPAWKLWFLGTIRPRDTVGLAGVVESAPCTWGVEQIVGPIVHIRIGSVQWCELFMSHPERPIQTWSGSYLPCTHHPKVIYSPKKERINR